MRELVNYALKGMGGPWAHRALCKDTLLFVENGGIASSYLLNFKGGDSIRGDTETPAVAFLAEMSSYPKQKAAHRPHPAQTI